MFYLLAVVEYASVAWDGYSEHDSQTPQRIQNRAACRVPIIIRKPVQIMWRDNSITKRQHHNVNTGKVPSYIKCLIPPLVCEISHYSLKNNSIISVPFNFTEILYSIIHYAVEFP